MLIGGGHSNAAFLAENLIDEIIISIHPLVLGEGIKLFEEVAVDLKLEKISLKQLNEDLVQIKYKVIK